MRKLHVAEMRRLTVNQFHEADKLPLVVVLDNVRSLHNVGSVFRTCDAFRVSRLILCGITSKPPASEIHKTALGAEDSVEWEYYSDTLQTVISLREQGYTLIALEQCEGSIMLDSQSSLSSIPSPIALILGNEVHGVSQDVIDKCQLCLEIPQSGTKHSLNVSVAAGIAIYHFYSLLSSSLT